MSDILEIDNDVAAANIEAFAREGRLVQGKWHDRPGGDGRDGGDGGRELACLLGSISPRISSASDCPASLMPAWLARLTVRLFDGLPPERMVEFGLAYGQRVRRWRVIDADGWERVRRAFITEVMATTLATWRERGGEKSPLWDPIKAMTEKVSAGLIAGNLKRFEWKTIYAEAYALRQKAWTELDAARRRRRAAAEAAAAEAAWAAAEAAAAEAAWAAAAWAAAAAAWAAAAEAWAAEAAEAAKRRESYAKSFETLLKVIDDELASADPQGRAVGS